VEGELAQPHLNTTREIQGEVDMDSVVIIEVDFRGVEEDRGDLVRLK